MKMVLRSPLCYAALFLFFPLSQQAVRAGMITYDANADFVPGVPNPNGVWSYGYTKTLDNYSFIAFDQYITSSNGFMWRHDLASSAPAFFKITNDGPVNGVANGQTALHGGPDGELAIVRFTAPATSFYDISAPWLPGDSGDADLYLLRNHLDILDSTPSTNTSGMLSRSHVFLNAGDTIELALGTAGDYLHDSTPVNLILMTSSVSSVPEPSSLLMYGCGILGLAVCRLRRLQPERNKCVRQAFAAK